MQQRWVKVKWEGSTRGYIKVDEIEKCSGERTRECSFDIGCSHCRKYIYITIYPEGDKTSICIERCTECTSMELNSIALYLLQHPESKEISRDSIETC